MLGVKTSTGPPLTFLFQGERLKTSTGGYSCFPVSRQEAKKVPRTFLLPKVGSIIFVVGKSPMDLMEPILL